MSDVPARFVARQGRVPSPGERLRHAWQNLAFFLGESEPPQTPVDPELLRRLARVHRLDAALAEPRFTTVSPERHLPAALWADWQTANASALAHAALREAPLRQVFAALAPLPVIALKGVAYAELLYPSPAARGMADVDLLVRAEQLDEALRRLAPLGYRKAYRGHAILDDPHFHERQLVGPLDLDLHQAFLQPARLSVDYSALFARAVPWPALAPNAWLLSPEDAVAYACIHSAIGEFAPSTAPAIGFLDLRQMLRRQGRFWGASGPALDRALVPQRAAEWGAERMVTAALYLAARVFPRLAAEAEGLCPELSLPAGCALASAIVFRAFPPPLSDPRRSELLIRKVFLLPPRARVRFAAYHLPRAWRQRARGQ